MIRKIVKNSLFSAVVIATTPAFGSQVTITNTFSAGTPARADEVNQNFTDVASAVNDNDSRITTNATDISNNATDISTNVTDIGTLTGRVDGNETSITTNASDISTINATLSTHDSRVTNLEDGNLQSVVVSGDLSKLLTGTVTVTANAITVTGIGTLFTSELNVGDAIEIEGEVHSVATINNDSELVLDAVHSAGASDALAYTDSDLLSLKNGDSQERLVVDKSGYLIRRMQRATGLGPLDQTDVGQIASRVLTFNKSRSDTSIRINYTDSMRPYNVAAPSSCRYELRVDGVSCPGGELTYDYYISPGGDILISSYSVVGYCDGIASGKHQIQVWVSSTPGYPGTDCATGWFDARWTLEAEEVF